MNTIYYDIVVLGAGPGGYVAAIKAAQLGAKVAVVEKEKPGGTCLNVGCIPTKALVKNAEILHTIKKAKNRGIKVGEAEVDMPETIRMKDAIVNQVVSGVSVLLASNDIAVYKGFGQVSNKRTVSIVDKDGKETIISYGKLMIATGSSPYIPPVPGMNEEGILTSTEILELQEVPKRLLVIGGGIIGSEFATVFSAFGSNVTVVEMLPRLVPNMDKDISQFMLMSLKAKGVDVLLESKVEKIDKNGDTYTVEISGAAADRLEFDKVLVSVGRKPNLSGLEDLGLEMEGHFIKTNEFLETNIEDVYAIGDVTGKIQLAHVASAQGIKAVENAMGKTRKMDYRFVPSCIYTIPEIGSVGLTEEEARRRYEDVAVGKFPLMASGKAFAMGEIDGMFKVITKKSEGTILGVHLFGASATELIAEATAIMQLNGTVEDLTDIIHAHPTISESIMEAGHAALGGCIHLPKQP